MSLPDLHHNLSVPVQPHLIPGPTPQLVSVVVLCCGQLEYTRLCVPSVLRFSRPPFEVIALDAGALDGTADYWAGVQAAAPARVEIVRSPSDADLPAALQDGLTHAKGEFVVLLNNDTVVTDNWLTQLTALAGMDPAVGMVAPMTTYGPGQQVVWPVPYRLGATAKGAPGPDEIRAQVEEVDRFAREWREKNLGQWFEAERLGGGCVLLKKAALQTIGPPPGAPLHFFDPEALSQRVRAAGFRLAGCRDLFIHSFGSRGFTSPAPSTADTQRRDPR
jgi:GT2 family glycosyltransferase